MRSKPRFDVDIMQSNLRCHVDKQVIDMRLVTQCYIEDIWSTPRYDDQVKLTIITIIVFKPENNT